MEAEKTANGPDQARAAEIAYHRRQNFLVLYMAAPSLIFFAGLYFHLSRYFLSFLFVLWIVNIIAGIFFSARLNDIRSLTTVKRATAGIGFALFATILLTGLWDPGIYYIILPWLFLYPLSAVMFFSRRLGFITATAFSVVAIIFFMIIAIPPWNAQNIKLFQYTSVTVLLTILVTSIIYEKTRMKVQDDLAISENQYKLAEMRQRETNEELQLEIEKRKQSEQALGESELHYRALFEESSVALWEEDWSQVKVYLRTLPDDFDGNLVAYFQNNPRALSHIIPLIKTTAANRSALKLFDIDQAGIMPVNLFTLLQPMSADYLTAQISSLFLAGRYHTEISGATPRGSKIHLMVNSALPAGYEKSWEKVFTSVYDLTLRIAMEEEKKRVDEQMQNARQLQAIGTLAGGIAHQFNNALAVIYGSLDLLEMNAQGNVENRRFLTSLKTSASRMSRLTDQLLAYAEGGKYQPQNFSVNDLVKEIIGSKMMLRDSTISVVTDLSSDVHLTTGDITQIKMVVEVVLSNAFEALNTGGHVKIVTGHKHLGEPVTKTDRMAAKPGIYTFICIEDDGSGMKDETLHRIFEPFFTTKIYGRGLGMAAAFGIVRNHDGMITVESELGKGTKVVIYLPSSDIQENRLTSLQ